MGVREGTEDHGGGNSPGERPWWLVPMVELEMATGQVRGAQIDHFGPYLECGLERQSSEASEEVTVVAQVRDDRPWDGGGAEKLGRRGWTQCLLMFWWCS